MRRVVITGLGMVTPLGCGVKTNWDRLMAGKSGIRAIDSFDVSDLPAKIAGMVPEGTKDEGGFDPSEWLEPKEQRKIDRFILFGMVAAQQAVEDSGWLPTDVEGQERTGVMIGSGIGGLTTIAEAAVLLQERGPRRISPFFIPPP